MLKLGLRPSLELLREVPVEEWEYWERTFIHWYRVLGWRVVNVTDGGEGLTNPSDETRAKCALGRKGKGHTPEARAAIGAAFRGKHLSDEHRAKISAYRQREKASGKKRKLSVAHRTAIGNGLRGRVVSAEARRNMGQAHKGKPLSVAHREKLRISHLGKVYGPMSPEHKAKIAATKVGERNPMFGKYGALNHMFGKHHTDATKARIRSSKKKRLTSP